MAMQLGNMGFGGRFDLSQPYQPSLQGLDGMRPGMVNLGGPNGMPAFGASQGMGQQMPSLMDIGQAQQSQPGSLMGFGNNQEGMMGAGAGPNYAGLAQGLMGMLGSKQGGEGEQAPPPPPAPILQGRSNGKLDELLARYGISTI